MPAVDLIDLVEQRMAQIAEDDPDSEAEATYFVGETGPWGFITVRDEEVGEVIGFEFVETGESWRRSDALAEYNEAASEEVEVVVIVPDEDLVEVAELVHEVGEPNVQVSDYAAMELVPMPLVS